MGTTTIGNSMKDTQIKPNDIAVILRPNHQSGVEWDGDFEVLVSGFGPVTMSKDDIDKLIAWVCCLLLSFHSWKRMLT